MENIVDKHQSIVRTSVAYWLDFPMNPFNGTENFLVQFCDCMVISETQNRSFICYSVLAKNSISSGLAIFYILKDHVTDIIV